MSTLADRIRAEGEQIGEQRGIQLGERRGIEIGEQRGIEIGEQRGIEIGEQRGIELGEQRGVLKGQIIGFQDALGLSRLSPDELNSKSLTELEQLLNELRGRRLKR